MKKTLLLTIALLFSVSIFAQDAPTNLIIDEHFDSTSLPEGWTTISANGNETSNWSISNTSNAGGEANELKLGWYPEFVGVTRIVSAPVDLTGIQNIVITMNHYFDNFNSATSTIGIATSIDNGYSWHNVWTKSYSNSGRYSIEEKILSPHMGYEGVLFCIFFDGASINFNNWYFDDFVVKIQDDLSLRLSEINLNDRMSSGPLNVKFTVQNMGSTAIQSIKATYQIEGQEPVTETFSVYLTSFENNTLTFTTTETLLPDTYSLDLYISEVNGFTMEQEEHTLSKTFSIAIAQTQRIPMIEHFSSSTCAPCVLINSLMLNLTNNNPGKFTYVKYPVNWPGVGDPYFIQEGYERCLYYGVSSVPLVFLDAVAQVANSTAQPVTNSALMARYNTPAFANIRGSFKIEGDNIVLSADVMSYIDLNDVKTYITVNEKTTTENTVEYGGNGEQEFHHIAMVMLDEGHGFDTDINAGEYKRFEYTYDMTQTNVEEMDDLEVAVWIQDPVTKEIFNSHFLYENVDHPYPAQNLQFTLGNRLKITWDAPENTEPTGYDLYVNNSLILSNTTQTSFSVDATDFCLAEVVALYDDKTSVGTVKIYSSSFATPQNIEAIVNDNEINVTWDAVEGATSYHLYRNGLFFAEAATNEYTDTQLENNTEYCYKVKAIFGNNESALSEETCVLYEGIGIDELETKFFITPNPAKDYVKLSAYNGQLSKVKIYNTLGMLVEEIAVNSNEIEINVLNYNKGIYFINLQTVNGAVTKKMIVE